MNHAAIFSPCRTWRYSLTREWEKDRGRLVVIGLNPSTADETQDDPTIRRCIGYAKRWHYGALLMLNLFAFRATDPRDMKAAADPVGPDNDEFLTVCTVGEPTVLCAWGAHGAFRDRGLAVVQALTLGTRERGVGAPRNLFVLGTTKAGQPKHPLYLRADLEPRPWSPL